MNTAELFCRCHNMRVIFPPVLLKLLNKNHKEDMRKLFLLILLMQLPMGMVAQNDNSYKFSPGLIDDAKEMLREFLENYKTAYTLRRIDYLNQIFSDVAVIINENNPSCCLKSLFLKDLNKLFSHNGLIHIRYMYYDILQVENKKGKEIYSFQIWQELNTPFKSEKGCLFMLVDMTDHSKPQIMVHTWQPNEVDQRRWYNAGDFYSE